MKSRKNVRRTPIRKKQKQRIGNLKSQPFSVRSLGRQHQALWHGLNRGRRSPLFNLDAFAALVVSSARLALPWDKQAVFENRGGATIPVKSQTQVQCGATCTPGVYLSGPPNGEKFLTERNRLLDGEECVDANVLNSILVSIFTSSDCDCPITALAIGQCMKHAKHKPFVLQDVRPFNPQLCRAAFDPKIGKLGGYTIPCAALPLRSGRFRISYRDVTVEEIKEHIAEQRWEQDLASANDSLSATRASVQKWTQQLDHLGLACWTGVGTRQRRSAIACGFYHLDWLFSDSTTGLPRTAQEVETLTSQYRHAPFEKQRQIFQNATSSTCLEDTNAAAKDVSLDTSAGTVIAEQDIVSLESALRYIRQPENNDTPLVFFTGSGLSSLVWLARHMTVKERSRVERIGLMLLTADPSQSILTSSSGNGISYNEAIDPDSVRECFSSQRKGPETCSRCTYDKKYCTQLDKGSVGLCSQSASATSKRSEDWRVDADEITLRKWFPAAAIFIWNTVSSKGVLEQDL
eukprot:scpid67492/ scgid33442/ 